MNDTALIQLDTARHALAECKTAMEAKQIADVAEAARVYLERTNASTETVNRATEIRLLAERQMGEFLKQMPKATGAAGVGPIAVPDGNRNQPPTLASIGITKKQSANAQKLADIPEHEFRERIAVAQAGGEKLSLAKVIAQAEAHREAISQAMMHAANACICLDKIQHDDPQLSAALSKVEQHIEHIRNTTT